MTDNKGYFAIGKASYEIEDAKGVQRNADGTWGEVHPFPTPSEITRYHNAIRSSLSPLPFDGRSPGIPLISSWTWTWTWQPLDMSARGRLLDLLDLLDPDRLRRPLMPIWECWWRHAGIVRDSRTGKIAYVIHRYHTGVRTINGRVLNHVSVEWS